MARSPIQVIEAKTLELKRDYIKRLLLVKVSNGSINEMYQKCDLIVPYFILAMLPWQKFYSSNCDEQSGSPTGREVNDDGETPDDPETAPYTAEVCTICLEQFHNGQDVCESRNEMCNHRFHAVCASEWLLKSQLCPCCRRNYLLRRGVARNDADATAIELEQQVEEDGNRSSDSGHADPIGSDGWIALLVLLDWNA
jgi:Ring finger domain